MDAESCWGARVYAVGTGVGCCQRWKDSTAEDEDVRAACQIFWNEDCGVSMSRGGCGLESVNFEAKVPQQLSPLLLEGGIFLRMISEEFAWECEAFSVDEVCW